MRPSCARPAGELVAEFTSDSTYWYSVGATRVSSATSCTGFRYSATPGMPATLRCNRDHLGQRAALVARFQHDAELALIQGRIDRTGTDECGDAGDRGILAQDSATA